MNNDLNFVIKKSGGSRVERDIDVSVTFVDNRRGAAFSFSPKASRMLGAQYITAAQKQGRVYFKPCDQKLGFKLSGKTDCGRVSARMPVDALGMTSQNWIGYYNLFWDNDKGMFYIDINTRQS